MITETQTVIIAVGCLASTAIGIHIGTTLANKKNKGANMAKKQEIPTPPKKEETIEEPTTTDEEKRDCIFPGCQHEKYLDCAVPIGITDEEGQPKIDEENRGMIQVPGCKTHFNFLIEFAIAIQDGEGYLVRAPWDYAEIAEKITLGVIAQQTENKPSAKIRAEK